MEVPLIIKILRFVKKLVNKDEIIHKTKISEEKFNRIINVMIDDKLIYKKEQNILITEFGKKIENDYKLKRNMKDIDPYISLQICIKCGHRVCPCCGVWCDIFLPDGKLCCNGKCTYEDYYF
jgi:predicted methyltransferase